MSTLSEGLKYLSGLARAEGWEIDEISASTRIADLDLDSFGYIEVLLRLEMELGVIADDQRIEQAVTVGDVLDALVVAQQTPTSR